MQKHQPRSKRWEDIQARIKSSIQPHDIQSYSPQEFALRRIRVLRRNEPSPRKSIIQSRTNPLDLIENIINIQNSERKQIVPIPPQRLNLNIELKPQNQQTINDKTLIEADKLIQSSNKLIQNANANLQKITQPIPVPNVFSNPNLFMKNSSSSLFNNNSNSLIKNPQPVSASGLFSSNVPNPKPQVTQNRGLFGDLFSSSSSGLFTKKNDVDKATVVFESNQIATPGMNSSLFSNPKNPFVKPSQSTQNKNISASVPLFGSVNQNQLKNTDGISNPIQKVTNTAFDNNKLQSQKQSSANQTLFKNNLFSKPTPTAPAVQNKGSGLFSNKPIEQKPIFNMPETNNNRSLFENKSPTLFSNPNKNAAISLPPVEKPNNQVQVPAVGSNDINNKNVAQTNSQNDSKKQPITQVKTQTSSLFGNKASSILNPPTSNSTSNPFAKKQEEPTGQSKSTNPFKSNSSSLFSKPNPFSKPDSNVQSKPLFIQTPSIPPPANSQLFGGFTGLGSFGSSNPKSSETNEKSTPKSIFQKSDSPNPLFVNPPPQAKSTNPLAPSNQQQEQDDDGPIQAEQQQIQGQMLYEYKSQFQVLIKSQCDLFIRNKQQSIPNIIISIQKSNTNGKSYIFIRQMKTKSMIYRGMFISKTQCTLMKTNKNNMKLGPLLYVPNVASSQPMLDVIKIKFKDSAQSEKFQSQVKNVK